MKCGTCGTEAFVVRGQLVCECTARIEGAKITIDLSPPVNTEVRRIAKADGISVNELLKRAFSLYKKNRLQGINDDMDGDWEKGFLNG